jgi:hypothetical protein
VRGGICGLLTLHIYRSSRRKGASSDPPFYAALFSVQSGVSVGETVYAVLSVTGTVLHFLVRKGVSSPFFEREKQSLFYSLIIQLSVKWCHQVVLVLPFAHPSLPFCVSMAFEGLY